MQNPVEKGAISARPALDKGNADRLGQSAVLNRSARGFLEQRIGLWLDSPATRSPEPDRPLTRLA